jgi:hypothetical protein
MLLTFAILNLLLVLTAIHRCRRKQAFKPTPILYPLGAFVWGDMAVFGTFWTIVGLISYIAQDTLLFLLIYSIFWLIRSLGETIYWLNQQFSTINRNPPHKLLLHHLFHDDSVWFAYQIFWQCLTVISSLTTLYLAKLWLQQ